MRLIHPSRAAALWDKTDARGRGGEREGGVLPSVPGRIFGVVRERSGRGNCRGVDVSDL